MNGEPNVSNVNDTIDVYWSPFIHDLNTDRLSIFVSEPDCLYNSMVEDYKARGMDVKNIDTNYLACPAVSNEMRKVFVFRAPVDYTITWDGESVRVEEYGQDFFNSMFNVRDIKSGFVSLRFKILLFAEKNLLVKQYPVFLFKGNFAENTTLIPGGFDVSEWFRPVEPAFYFNQKNVPLRIKKGEPLYYLVFETDKKINFKRFSINAEIHDVVERCVSVKKFMSNSKLDFLYDLFTKSGHKKRLLKVIKDSM